MFFQNSDDSAAPGSSASWSYVFPDAGLAFSVTEYVFSQDGKYQHGAKRNRLYSSLPLSTTFDPTTLATIDLELVDITDPSHPVMTWSSGPGPRGDYLEVVFVKAGQSQNYHFYMPVDAASPVRIPDVPPSLPQYAPTYTTINQPVSWYGYIYFVDQEGESGWAGTSLFGGAAIDGLGSVESSAEVSPPP